MVKRNVFTFEFTVVCLVGIFFFNSFATPSSISSLELSTDHCCSDLSSQDNTAGIEVADGTIDNSEYSDGNSTSLNQKVNPPTQITADSDEEDSFDKDNLCLLSDPTSNCQKASRTEETDQNATAKDKNLNQATQLYSSLNNSDSSNTSNHSLSLFINSSHHDNVITNVLKQPNSTGSNLLESTLTRIEVSPESIVLDEASKADTTEQYTTSQLRIIKNITNKSLPESSPQEPSNNTFEIVLLNSTQQAQGSNISEELAYGSKNYYQLQRSNLGHSSIKTTVNEIHEESKESSSFNSSSVLLDFLSIGNSTIRDVKILFNNSSLGNVYKNSEENAQMNNTTFNYKGNIETSSQVPSSETSTTNHPLFYDLQEITSKKHIPISNQDCTPSIVPTTEHEGEINNTSSGFVLFNSLNETSPLASQVNLTNTSSTKFSIDDPDNEKFHHAKITYLPLVSVVASHSAGAISSKARALTTNTDVLYASTSSPMTEDSLGKNGSRNNSISMNIEISGKIDANTTSKSQSIGGSIMSPPLSTEIYPASATPLGVDQIPSVMLAIENTHPVSKQFSSKKQYPSTFLSSTDSYLGNEHIESSTSQTLEKTNKIMISTNDFPSSSSTIVDSVIAAINNILNKTRNDKILAHAFSNLSSNSTWNGHQSESDNQQFNVFDHSLGNKDPSSTQASPTTTVTPEPTTNMDKSKIFWKPLTNLLLSTELPAFEEATTERRIFWNMCFTKKPDLFSPRNPKETLMTKGPGKTKVFWNLCPTKKPYIATSSYHPTDTLISTSTSPASSPLSLSDNPNPSASGFSPEENPSETTSPEDDLTTTLPTETTYVTFMEIAPEETTQALEEKKEYLYPIYWNVPTFQCHKYGLNFSRVKDWGLQQNYQDEFRGEEIAILYDPGEFPALLPASGGRRIQRNGGVPQEGSLTRHLSLFQNHIEKLIPNVNFSGLAIIDFEHWRPVWRQNWGSLSPYREFSRLIEKRRHPFWFSTMVELEATYRYELGARVFLLDTLRLGKKLRPQAKWGYYGFPFCFNYTPYNNRASCSYEVQFDNDNMYWLFSETTAYYPSLYLKYNDMYSSKRQRFIKGRLDETLRIAQGVSVYPYVWYKYHDNHHFLTKDDMMNLLKIPKDYGCKGAVIWGASRDVNSREKCLALQSYLEEVIGPAVRDIHEESFREGTVGHQQEEDYEEDFEEDKMEIKEKKISYDVREFEV